MRMNEAFDQCCDEKANYIVRVLAFLPGKKSEISYVRNNVGLLFFFYCNIYVGVRRQILIYNAKRRTTGNTVRKIFI